MQLSLLVLVALSVTAHAFPRRAFAPPANGTEISCGRNEYTLAKINSAADAACKHVEADTTAGSSSYPHTYRNDEDFDFNGVDGPYFEFPMKLSGVYKGGSPGADRVIINGDCDLAGQITHSGASGNAFVACEGTS